MEGNRVELITEEQIADLLMEIATEASEQARTGNFEAIEIMQARGTALRIWANSTVER